MINWSPIPVNTRAAQPLANPSSPSVRFVALLSAINTNNANGQIKIPILNDVSHKRKIL